jgi:hypothetical protein
VEQRDHRALLGVRRDAGDHVNRDARECLRTAAEILTAATGCQPSLAAQIVELIALGTIRWNAEETPEPRIPVVMEDP